MRAGQRVRTWPEPNFSSEETILMARNPEWNSRTSRLQDQKAIVGVENILILEDHHLHRRTEEGDSRSLRFKLTP